MTKRKINTKPDYAAEIEASQQAHQEALATQSQRQTDLDNAEMHEAELTAKLRNGDDAITAADLAEAQAAITRATLLLAAADKAVAKTGRAVLGDPWVAQIVAEALNGADLGYEFTGTAKGSQGGLEPLHGEVVQKAPAHIGQHARTGKTVLTITTWKAKVHRSIAEAEIVAALAEHPRIAAGDTATKDDGSVVASGIEVEHLRDHGDRDAYRVTLTLGAYPEFVTVREGAARKWTPNLTKAHEAIYSTTFGTHFADVELPANRSTDGLRLGPRSAEFSKARLVDQERNLWEIEARGEVVVNMKQVFADAGLTDSTLRHVVNAIESQTGGYVGGVGRITGVTTKVAGVEGRRLQFEVTYAATFEYVQAGR